MEKGLWLSVACAVCDSIAYVWYNIEFWRGRSKPNRVTWGLWSYIAILHATSYLVASHDLVKTIVDAGALVLGAGDALNGAVDGVVAGVAKGDAVDGREDVVW